MEIIAFLVDFILNVDVHLEAFVHTYGTWVYALLFLIIFVETGVVVMPFLPGDSLLFGAGALAYIGELNIWLLLVTLIAAAVIGDNCNYWIGRTIGKRFLGRPNARILKKEHLDRTHAFFEKYGKWAIILARFMPFIRTFMPFVAGVGRMSYAVYLTFDVVGALVWVGVCVPAGYFFGSIPLVKNNFSIVVLGIIAVSLIPAAVGAFLAWRDQKRTAMSQPSSAE